MYLPGFPFLHYCHSSFVSLCVFGRPLRTIYVWFHLYCLQQLLSLTTGSRPRKLIGVNKHILIPPIKSFQLFIFCKPAMQYQTVSMFNESQEMRVHCIQVLYVYGRPLSPIYVLVVALNFTVCRQFEFNSRQQTKKRVGKNKTF